MIQRDVSLYHAPDPLLKVPEISDRPSNDEIAAARQMIEHAIGEFPYADKASKANTIAAMLTPIVRPAISGPTPLGILGAPQAGTGKSLLADVVSIIPTGRHGEMFSAPRGMRTNGASRSPRR